MTNPQFNPQLQYVPPPQYIQPQQPQYQAPPPAPVAPIQPATLDPTMRIAAGDQRFPRELWGKTVGEAMQIFGLMREEFMASRRQAQLQFQQPAQPGQAPAFPASRPQQPQQPQAPQAPQQPGVPRYIPQSGAEAGQDSIRQMLREELGLALPQVMAPLQQVSAQTVLESVRRKFPDWDRYALEIMQETQGVDPQGALNPNFWETAYYVVKGRAMSQPAQQPGAYLQQPNYPQGHQPAPAQFGPGAVRRPDGTIVAPPPDFGGFIEPPSQSYQTPDGQTYNPQRALQDPQTAVWARRWNVDPRELVLWGGGHVPTPAEIAQATGRANGNGGY